MFSWDQKQHSNSRACPGVLQLWTRVARSGFLHWVPGTWTVCTYTKCRASRSSSATGNSDFGIEAYFFFHEWFTAIQHTQTRQPSWFDPHLIFLAKAITLTTTVFCYIFTFIRCIFISVITFLTPLWTLKTSQDLMKKVVYVTLKQPIPTWRISLLAA